MKKYSLILAVLAVFAIFAGAFAQEEWTAWTPDTAGDPIACELAAPVFENEEYKAILGEVTENDWAIGPEDAPLTVIEYADFQCPYCANAGLTAIAFQASHPEEVRYVYRHFPLSFHEKAPMSAYAADAAGKQGFFFETEAFLYETQNEWSSLESLEVFDTWLREHMAEAVPEMDFDQWVTDYESEELRAVVDESFGKVSATGIVNGTPTFFANFFQTNYDPATLEKYLSVFKLQRSYKTECPAVVVETGKSYRAVLHTSVGDVTIDLLADAAPNLVSNFISLAADGWYNGNAFHNVLPGFVAQTGDPTGIGTGLAGYYVADENLNSGAFSEPGTVAMANTGADKNGSQFFIALDLNEYFGKDGADPAAKIEAMEAKYSVFGRVAEESMELLQQITEQTVIDSIDIQVKG